MTKPGLGPLKICVFGAGAIGGALAVRLALVPGVSLSVIARGAHLTAISTHGLRLTAPNQAPCMVRLHATDDAFTLGPQDLVITALKGQQLPAAAHGIAALLGPETRVINIQNGIPWWYFYRDAASGRAGERIAGLDPGGALWELVGPARIIGGIAYHSAEIFAPGHVHLASAGRFILGEPSGALSPDLETASQLLEGAGWQVGRSARIRDEIWRKLLGNAAFNPVSALTRANLAEMIDNQAIAAVIKTIMTEVRAIGEACGARFDVSPEERMAQARQMGPVKPSMLQDLERGRALEITPLLGAVSYLGQQTKVPAPILDTMLALVSQLDFLAREKP